MKFLIKILMDQAQINQKIKWNAISAYLLLFISVLFLFNKDNVLLNNKFVKNHVKTAFFIHIIFLLIYIIFIHYSLLKSIYFFSFSINTIIVSSLFIINFWFLIFWIYRANNWKTFQIWEIINITKSDKIVDVKTYKILNEKEKLTVILAYIPFISYIIYPNFENNQNLRDTIKFNFFISLFITILYITWFANLAIFLILLYIVFAVFAWINIILKNEVISFNFSFLCRFRDFEMYLKSFKTYINFYLKWKFVSLNEIVQKNIELEKIEKNKELEILNSLAESKIPKKIIYFPIINFLFLFSVNSKYKNHIINWISISISMIILYLFYWFSNIFYIFLFPICFWIGYLKTNLNYKMPFIYHIFNIFIKWHNKIKSLKRKSKEIKNTVKEEKFKFV